MTHTVFYSWQSDLPGRRNRSFIETAAERALKALRSDSAIVAALDRDTKNVGGMPDIADTIFDKIRSCDLFLADVTPVAGRGGLWRSEAVPNPNVMVELGFAVRELSWDRVVCVSNASYQGGRSLPFHIRQRRRPIEYRYGRFTSSVPEVRDQLVKDLKNAFEAILRGDQHPRRQGLIVEQGTVLDTQAGQRILHANIRNVSRRALCRGSVTVEDMTGTWVCGASLRFSDNPAPSAGSAYARESWDSEKGDETSAPLVIKLAGSTSAHLFTSASMLSTNWIDPTVPALTPGTYRLLVRIAHGTDRATERVFIVRNLGSASTGLTFQEARQ